LDARGRGLAAASSCTVAGRCVGSLGGVGDPVVVVSPDAGGALRGASSTDAARSADGSPAAGRGVNGRSRRGVSSILDATTRADRAVGSADAGGDAWAVRSPSSSGSGGGAGVESTAVRCTLRSDTRLIGGPRPSPRALPRVQGGGRGGSNGP